MTVILATWKQTGGFQFEKSLGNSEALVIQLRPFLKNTILCPLKKKPPKTPKKKQTKKTPQQPAY